MSFSIDSLSRLTNIYYIVAMLSDQASVVLAPVQIVA